MNIKNNNILIITSDLSRGLISLSRELTKRGFCTTIAAPKSKNEIYLLNENIIHLTSIKIFGKIILFKTKKLKHFIEQTNPIIHCIDNPASRLDFPRKINFTPNIGLDLKIWNPTSVSALRQTQFLAEYNIAHHQKLISIISPLGYGLGQLLDAVKSMNRDDFIIALIGRARNFRKMIKQIAQNGVDNKIVLVGDVSDMPTLLRAGFANVSLGNQTDRTLQFALAMGRPCVWDKSNTDIKPNINLATLDSAAIAKSLNSVLDMNAEKRIAAEKSNITAAKKFSIENSIKECMGKYSSL